MTDLALVYYQLLVEEKWESSSLKAFEPFRQYQLGEITYEVFRTLDFYLSLHSIQSISAVNDLGTPWLPPMEDPVLPVHKALLDLFTVSYYVRMYLSLTSAVGKRNALINAGLSIENVRKILREIVSPEKVLIERVAQQWSEIITAEQTILAAPREVRHVRNMYLVGRPVRPDSGHPFVGRRDQFDLIDRQWRDATLKPPIVLHGQRRMGKTSILYHLEKILARNM